MNDIRTVHVGLQARAYDIHIGSGLLAQAVRYIAPVLAAPRVIIVADTNVALQYEPRITQSLRSGGIQVDTIRVAAGEGSKSFAGYSKLMESLLALTPDRKTTLLALGGGVIGDLTGFAASTLLRGVPFIQVPTSLLAQVDSSVGGKTAINAKAGKNLIGSFYQPRLVLADLKTLQSLPIRQLRAGYAEIIKYGLIMDSGFYSWCLDHGAAVIAGDSAARAQAIESSCRMKADIVAADEREADRRAILNFGHTFGHALEAETGYSDTLLHGEAVAIGMVMACRLSAELGMLGREAERGLASHLRAVGLPTSPLDIAPQWNIERLLSHCFSDKKAEARSLTFIALDAIGSARVIKNVDAELVRVVMASFMKG